MTLEPLFCALRDEPGLVWLDDPAGRSILAWRPAEVHTGADDWPEALRALSRSGPVLGWIGYEAGRAAERVAEGRPTPEPPVWLARYEGVCVAHGGRVSVSGTPSFRRLARARLAAAPDPPPPPPPPRGRTSTVARPTFLEAVDRIRRWLLDGDCYQVNLSRPVFLAPAPDPVDTYRRLRTRPAAFGAFLQPAPGTAVLSNSPELLLRVSGRSLRSDPIKGTRPRGADPAQDAALLAELAASPKELAELTMIADLVRNDLYRVAAPGTVRSLGRQLRTHPTLHHAHWPVTARLARGRDAIDALVALFPPGSVTGAPKIRATERIAVLEPHARGVYCGAIGHVLGPGDATFSVAIRTAVVAGGQARWHVGGGIVLDSVPAAEWDETEVKELALRAAFLA